MTNLRIGNFLDSHENTDCSNKTLVGYLTSLQVNISLRLLHTLCRISTLALIPVDSFCEIQFCSVKYKEFLNLPQVSRSLLFLRADTGLSCALHAFRSILEQLNSPCISMECSGQLITLCFLYNTAIRSPSNCHESRI